MVNVSGNVRHSLNFFFDPDHDCVVEPLAQFVTETKPARYAPVTMGAHLARNFDGVFAYRKPSPAEAGQAA